MPMVSVAGVLPLAGDTVSQLPPDCVVAAAVNVTAALPAADNCTVWLAGDVVAPVFELKVSDVLDSERAIEFVTIRVTGTLRGLFDAPGTMTVTWPVQVATVRPEPAIPTVTVVPLAVAVSQPVPHEVVVGTAVTLVLVGTPPTVTVWLAGFAAPCGIVNVSEVGLTVACAATINVTGTISVGTLVARVIVIVPLYVPGRR